MMNLELLFWAARESGDSTFYKIAVTHADTTMKNHFRPDYSSFHVVDYDTLSGKVLGRQTHQGYADSSAWARGQAWGLYGYTVCYRETKDPKYLAQAENIAGLIFSNKNMPEDLIPYWDYDAPGIPDEPRDVSAATVAASALYELSTFSADSVKYRAWADRIIDTLSANYLVLPGTMHGFCSGRAPDTNRGEPRSTSRSYMPITISSRPCCANSASKGETGQRIIPLRKRDLTTNKTGAIHIRIYRQPGDKNVSRLSLFPPVADHPDRLSIHFPLPKPMGSRKRTAIWLQCIMKQTERISLSDKRFPRILHGREWIQNQTSAPTVA